MSSAPSSSRVDLVVVGAGPQTLRALADLETALAQRPAAGRVREDGVRVVAVDPVEPGAGAVWRVDQPDCLGMNVRAALVDLRCPSVPWDLREWHERTTGRPCATYPARALVGRYLRWVWERLTTSAWLRLEHRAGTVEGLDRVPGGWRCRTAGDGADARVPEAERVLLCTGHDRPFPFDHARLVAGDEATGPGRTVVVEGAALTAFDAVMCLTAGRGGSWEPDLMGGLVPRYRPVGAEPDRIVLVSRSGRMMLPKPAEPDPATADAVASVRERWARDEPLDRAWWEVLLEAAGRAAAAGGAQLDPDAARRSLDDPTPTTGARALAARWRADLRRAAGDVDEDPAWWLGRAWSAAYPDLLASIERHGRDPRTWSRFRRRAATLERWAFGPPAELVARLVALMDAGRLDVVTRPPSASPPGLLAHIPAPGVLPRPRPWGTDVPGAASSPLWSDLIAAGHVTVREGESGVLTTPTGTCVRADGTASPGLSALGRPTEGPVVDHDSLQRHLHLDATRWAGATAAAFGSSGPRHHPCRPDPTREEVGR